MGLDKFIITPFEVLNTNGGFIMVYGVYYNDINLLLFITCSTESTKPVLPLLRIGNQNSEMKELVVQNSKKPVIKTYNLYLSETSNAITSNEFLSHFCNT